MKAGMVTACVPLITQLEHFKIQTNDSSIEPCQFKITYLRMFFFLICLVIFLYFFVAVLYRYLARCLHLYVNRCTSMFVFPHDVIVMNLTKIALFNS